jgi:methylthioribose-1-phosphate isomerase
MKVDGRPMRTLWPAPQRDALFVIDRHPRHVGARRAADRRHRGLRPGLQMNARPPTMRRWNRRPQWLQQARPTAVNLAWAVQRMLAHGAGRCRRRPGPGRLGPRPTPLPKRTCRSTPPSASTAWRCCRPWRRKAGPVNVLTHCNAGWLATVDWGTATSAIYQAHAAGLPVHVWVDETRPAQPGRQPHRLGTGPQPACRTR